VALEASEHRRLIITGEQAESLPDLLSFHRTHVESSQQVHKPESLFYGNAPVETAKTV
jgi:hypothetical protein